MTDTLPDKGIPPNKDIKTADKKPKPGKKLLYLEKGLFIVAVTAIEFFAMLEYTKMQWIASPLILPIIAVPLALAALLVRMKRKKLLKQNT